MQGGYSHVEVLTILHIHTDHIKTHPVHLLGLDVEQIDISMHATAGLGLGRHVFGKRC